MIEPTDSSLPTGVDWLFSQLRRLLHLPKGARRNGRAERAFVAMPLLGLSILAFVIMDARSALPPARDILQGGEIIWADGAVPVRTSFYGVKWLDDLLSVMNMFFVPSIYGYDHAAHAQALSFLSDAGVLLAVWLIESLRSKEALWFLRVPGAFALAGQLLGMGVVCPFYYFLHYVFSPAAVRIPSTANQRQVLAAFSAVVVAFSFPASAMFFWPRPDTRQAWLFLWQLYPLYMAVTYAVASLVLPESPIRLSSTAATRLCIACLSGLGATVWLWTTHGSLTGIAPIFIPTAIPRFTLPDFTAFCRQFLSWDEVFVFGSSLLWLAYLINDLDRLGPYGWPLVLLGTIICTTTLGPGTTVGLGWLLREELLARKSKNKKQGLAKHL
ncbi:hypothetical protein B0T26DRAFT_682250 [Lasiosphaeria miniovina]|uniref:Uncharacterized protein n=1 Tax=Lasiosphaeria miniovina TaxID=1954250 RepID=A0AA40BEQ6_9PEZI|nr:uncharacterized protein B0T26DRAFT_682250 [Lasiosphaeria miniovina]KAK0732898.1 hypothetical protein B0T26DRAFT_682250 [Lasiosphaeria miniovina]